MIGLAQRVYPVNTSGYLGGVGTPEPGRMADVPALASILWAFEAEAEWLPRRRARRSDLALLARLVRRGHVRLIRDGAGVLAFVIRDGGRVHALYVARRGRGMGLGSTLLEEAKALGPGWLELWTPEANTAARGFYAGHGFAEAPGDGSGNDAGLPEKHLTWGQWPVSDCQETEFLQ